MQQYQATLEDFFAVFSGGPYPVVVVFKPVRLARRDGKVRFRE
jgi:hypothetical protein